MSKYQQKIIKEFESKGWKVEKVVKLGRDGYPDLIMWKDGQTQWIECKEETDTLKPLQKFRIDELNKSGIKAFAMQDKKGCIYGNS